MTHSAGTSEPANEPGAPTAPDPDTVHAPSPAERRQGAAIIDICGMQVAFGLSWRRLKGYAAPDREARAEARRLGATAVVVRTQKRHFGFARDLDLPRVRRARAAAASIADAFPHTMMGAWALPDGRWWCVALDRGEVYPMFGDLIVADEAAARQWFTERRPENDWSTLVVPVEWDPDRARHQDLDLLLANNSGATLDPARSGLPGTPARIVAGVALIVVAAAGAFWMLTPTPRPKRPLPKPVVAAEPPPTIIPSPAAVAATCAKLLEAVSPALPSAGWTGTRAKCAADFTAMQVLLTATVRPLVPEAPGLLPIRVDGVAVDFTKGAAVITRSAPLPSVGSASLAAPPTASEMAQRLVSAATRVGARLAVDQTARIPGQTKLRWTADNIVHLPTVIAALNEVAGVRLTEMDLDLNSFAWTLTGEVDVSPNT